MLSKDPAVMDRAYMITREASEAASTGHGKVRRLQWRLAFKLDRSEAASVVEIPPQHLEARSVGPLDLLTGGGGGRSRHQESFFQVKRWAWSRP